MSGYEINISYHRNTVSDEADVRLLHSAGPAKANDSSSAVTRRSTVTAL